MPLFFLGTREWRNRQTRTVQVRVPVMEWGFNSPLAHDETAGPSGSAVFVFPGCGLWPRWCSGRRRARPLCVSVGGGPPARRPRCELRSARRLEARPGPATAHGNRSLARLFLWVSWGSRVLSFWGARVRVVTNVVHPRCFSCGFLLRCYERRQSEGFFAEVPVEGLCWASFFAEMLLKGLCWASSFAPIGPAPRSCRRRGARGWLRWGVLQH